MVAQQVVSAIDSVFLVHVALVHGSSAAGNHELELVLPLENRGLRLFLLEIQAEWRIPALLESGFAAGRNRESDHELSITLEVANLRVDRRFFLRVPQQVIGGQFQDHGDRLIGLEQRRRTRIGERCRESQQRGDDNGGTPGRSS